MQHNENHNADSRALTTVNPSNSGIEIKSLTSDIKLTSDYKKNINSALEKLNQLLSIQSKRKLELFQYFSQYPSLNEALSKLDLKIFKIVAERYEPFRYLLYYDGNQLAQIAYHAQTAIVAIEQAQHSLGQGAHIKETDDTLRKKKIQLEKLKEKCIEAMLEHLRLRYKPEYVGEGLLYRLLGDINLLASKNHSLDKLDAKLRLKEGCDVVVLTTDPNSSPINDIPIKSNAAYVYYAGKITYVNKADNQCTQLQSNEKDLQNIYIHQYGNKTFTLPGPNAAARTLSQAELLSIEKITKHSHRNPKAIDLIADNNLINLPATKMSDQKIESTPTNERNYYLYTASLNFLNAIYDGMVRMMNDSLVNDDGRPNCLPKDTKDFFVLFIYEFGTPQDRTELNKIKMGSTVEKITSRSKELYETAKSGVSATVSQIQLNMPATPTLPITSALAAKLPPKPPLTFIANDFSYANFLKNIITFQTTFPDSGYDFLTPDRLAIVDNTIQCVMGFEKLLGEEELAIYATAKKAWEEVKDKNIPTQELHQIIKEKITPAVNLSHRRQQQQKIIDDYLNVSAANPNANYFKHLNKTFAAQSKKLEEINKIEKNWQQQNKYANLSSSALTNLTIALQMLEMYCQHYIKDEFIENASFYETSYRRPLNGMLEAHVQFVRQNVDALQTLIASERMQIAEEMLCRLALIDQDALKRIVHDTNSTESASNDVVRYTMRQLLPYDAALRGSASRYLQMMPKEGLSQQNRKSILDANSFIERYGSLEAKAVLGKIFDKTNYPNGIPYSTIAVDDEIGEFDILEVPITRSSDKVISELTNEFIKIENLHEIPTEELFEFIPTDQTTDLIKQFLDLLEKERAAGRAAHIVPENENSYIKHCLTLQTLLPGTVFNLDNITQIALVELNPVSKDFIAKINAAFEKEENRYEAILMYVPHQNNTDVENMNLQFNSSISKYLKKVAGTLNIPDEDFLLFDKIIKHIHEEKNKTEPAYIEKIAVFTADELHLFKKIETNINKLLDSLRINPRSPEKTLELKSMDENNSSNLFSEKAKKSYVDFFIKSYWFYFFNNATHSQEHALAEMLIMAAINLLNAHNRISHEILTIKKMKPLLENQAAWQTSMRSLLNDPISSENLSQLNTNLSQLNQVISQLVSLISEKKMLENILQVEVDALNKPVEADNSDKKPSKKSIFSSLFSTDSKKEVSSATKPVSSPRKSIAYFELFIGLVEDCQSFTELEEILKKILSALPNEKTNSATNSLRFHYANSERKIRETYASVVERNTTSNKK